MLRNRFLSFIVVFGILCAAAAGCVHTYASAAFGRSFDTVRYESILIQSGDTLWSIAETNCGSSRTSDIRSYVQELQRMNHLPDATELRAGAYLIVYHKV